MRSFFFQDEIPESVFPSSTGALEPKMQPARMRRTVVRFICLIGVLAISIGMHSSVHAQNFARFPGHPGTYGDHTVNTTWEGGPSEVTLTFESDESVLHTDGTDVAQRTARNTLNFVDDGLPQNFDNLDVISRYGSNLPLLQQLSAAGTSQLDFASATPVNELFDLFITDVDSGDAVNVRAFDNLDNAIDMTTWTLFDEGDLSLIKDTGDDVSDIIAPVPLTEFTFGGIGLTAVNSTNYNRSYSILRAPTGLNISRVQVEFTGLNNSPSREFGGNGSHIYVALSAVPEPGSGTVLLILGMIAAVRRNR